MEQVKDRGRALPLRDDLKGVPCGGGCSVISFIFQVAGRTQFSSSAAFHRSVSYGYGNFIDLVINVHHEV